jgi:hypothetical protein
MSIPVTPYIETVGTDIYKTLMLEPFNHKNILKYFIGWNNTDHHQYDKPNDKLFDRLRFYIGYYTINSNVYRLPLPQTLNDFISDMHRAKIELEWNEKFIKEYSREYSVKDFYKQSELKNYYNNLLTQLDKLNELI